MSDNTQEFNNILARAKNIVILCGAGLSAGSGIPTYRGAGGLWLEHDDMACATPEAFDSNPSRLWQWYGYRRDMCLKAKPNAAHEALATLFLPYKLASIAPAAYAAGKLPLLITQNIDALSTRVLDTPELNFSPEDKDAAKAQIFEMHGNIFSTLCTSCKAPKTSYDPVLCTALANPEKVKGESYRDIPLTQLPRCGGDDWKGSNRYGKCGGLLRPDVVWFGEIPKHMGDIARTLNWCDLLIVVGTSSTVQPASGFASTVKSRGGHVAIFDLEPSERKFQADFAFYGPCEETLPKALGAI